MVQNESVLIAEEVHVKKKVVEVRDAKQVTLRSEDVPVERIEATEGEAKH